MPIKSVKMKISKNKKMRFFLMSQGSLTPKIRFLGHKVCPVARVRTDTHESDYWGHPFRVSGFFFKFSFNLSSRRGPINTKTNEWMALANILFLETIITLYLGNSEDVIEFRHIITHISISVHQQSFIFSWFILPLTHSLSHSFIHSFFQGKFIFLGLHQ